MGRKIDDVIEIIRDDGYKEYEIKIMAEEIWIAKSQLLEFKEKLEELISEYRL